MKLRLTIISTLVLSLSNVYAQDVEKAFTSKMVTAFSYVTSQKDNIWPEFPLNQTPVIGHFTTDQYTHIYAFNFKPVNPAWQRLNVNNTPVYYIDNDLYNISNIAWGFEDIDGQDSFIRWQNPDSTGTREAASSLYFRFFNYQHFDENSKFVQSWPWDYLHYDGGSHQLLSKLNFLEVEALKTYLKTNDMALKEKSLLDAVAINQYRSNLMNTESRDYEVFMSRNWGLSGYVSWKSLNLATDAKYLQAKESSCEIFKTTNLKQIRNCLYYYRYNFTTLVYGLALDKKMGSTWKFAIERTHTSADEILKKHIALSDDAVITRINDIIKSNRYDAKKIDYVLNQVQKPYLDEVEKQQNNYKQLDGVELEIVNNPHDGQRSKSKKTSANKKRFKVEDEDNFYWINNRLILQKDFSDEIKHIHMSEAFTMTFKKLAYVYQTMPFSNVGSDWYKFKLSAQSKLVVDGIEDTLGNFMQAKKQVSFKNLTIENDNATIRLNAEKGELDSSGDRVRLKFQFKN